MNGLPKTFFSAAKSNISVVILSTINIGLGMNVPLSFCGLARRIMSDHNARTDI